MPSFDFAPLYRSSVGFDRMASLLDGLAGEQPSDKKGSTYPPYNIEVAGENHYRVSLAVAGFEQSDLEVESEENRLLVRGNKPEKEEGQYLHRGIATRSFERRFQLADHVRVAGARFENGLLHIDLVREIPERMKPRSIAINAEPVAGEESEVNAA